MNNKFFHFVSVLIVGIAFSVGIGYLFAWTGPSSAPPDGNVAAPINMGIDTQTKTGDVCTTFGGTLKCLSTAGGGGGAPAAKVRWFRTTGILNSSNVSSVTSPSSNAIVNFITPMSSDNYYVVCNGKSGSSSDGAPSQLFVINRSSTSFEVQGHYASGGDTLYRMECVVYE